MWNLLARYGNSAVDKIRRIYNQIPITWLPTRSDQEAKRYLKTEKVRSYLSAYGNIARFLPLIDTYTEETAEIRRMYRIMLRDPYVKAAMFTKVFSVASLDLQVNPASKENLDKDAAEWVQYALDHHLGGTEQLIYNILVHGLIDGFSVGEMVWDEVPRGKYKGRVFVRELKPKDSKFLILEGDSYRNVTGVQDLRSASTYHPSNFAIWSHMPLYDSPTGMSDFRAAYRAFWLIDTAWQLRAIAMERYGLPILIGRYDGDSGRQLDFESKLDQLRSQSWITLPPDMQVEALNLAGATKESEFQAAINDLREEMAVAITGASLQMLQGQVADGRGSSQVHKNTSELVQWYLRAQIQAVLYNQMVPALVEYNLPGADYPTVSLGSVSDADLEATLRVDQGLQQLGWVHSKEEIQEKYGRRLPKDKGDELQPQQQQGMGMGGFPGMGGDMGGGMPPEGPDDPNGGGGDDTDLASLLATGKFSEEQTRAILKFAERQRKMWRSPERDPKTNRYRYSKTKKRGWLPPNSEHAAEGIKPKSAEPIGAEEPSQKAKPAKPRSATPDDLSRSLAQIADPTGSARIADLRKAMGNPANFDQMVEQMARNRDIHLAVDDHAALATPEERSQMVKIGGNYYIEATLANFDTSLQAQDAKKTQQPQDDRGARGSRGALPTWTPQWTDVDGTKVMRIPGSKYVAVPTSGKQKSKAWDIIDIEKREFVAQLKGDEYDAWLVKMARNEGVEPTGSYDPKPEQAKPQPKAKKTKPNDPEEPKLTPWAGKRLIHEDDKAAIEEARRRLIEAHQNTTLSPREKGQAIRDAKDALAELKADSHIRAATQLQSPPANKPDARGEEKDDQKPDKNTTSDRKRWESVFGTLNAQPIDTPLNGYESGLQLIQKFNGQQVSKRKTTTGTDLVTYRVDFPGTSYLLTWGHPGPIMTRGEGRKVRLPMKWQMVSFANDLQDDPPAPPPSLDDYRSKRDQVAPVDLDANEDLPAEPEQRKQKTAKPEPQHIANTNDLISRLKDGDARRMDILQHVVNLSAGKDANSYKKLVQDITGKKPRTTDDADEMLHKHIAKEAGRPELFSEQDVKKRLIADDPANRDFTNAEQLLERAVRWGNKALSALVRRVIERNPTYPEFLQEDRNVMTEIIARVMAPANLLGQYRVRKLAEIAEKNIEQFSDQEVIKFAEPIQPMAPKNALEYFRSLVPAWNLEPNWTDNLRKRAFTMAVTSEQTILDRVRSIIDKSLALGQVDQDQPVVQIQSVLEEAGISPRNSQYSEMLFRTNMMQAYTQGSQQAMRDPKVADLFPVWRYTGIRDGRQGKDHEVHFGKYYPASVDFDSVRGPRVYNCRCNPSPLSKFKWQRLQQNGARLAMFSEDASVLKFAKRVDIPADGQWHDRKDRPGFQSKRLPNNRLVTRDKAQGIHHLTNQYRAGKRNTKNSKLSNAARPKLDLLEKAVLKEYTAESTNTSAHFLNKALWQGKVPQRGRMKRVDDALQSAFAKAQPFKKPVLVRRVLPMSQKQAEQFIQSLSGQTEWTSKGYFSATTTIENLQERHTSPVELIIKANHGIDMKPYSHSAYEDELLINRGSQFKILSIKKRDGKYQVRMAQQ